MDWTPREAAVVADVRCPYCVGHGVRSLPSQPVAICSCVFRSVFRTCFNRFRHCAQADPFSRIVSFERVRGAAERRLSWVRRNEDYCADFQKAGARCLPTHLYRVFSFQFLLGADPPAVAKRLGISRTILYEWAEAVMVEVGREIAYMRPYSLFPPSEYLAASNGQATPPAVAGSAAIG